jgi:hypothetical protein
MSRSWLPPEPPRGHPGWVVASVLAHAAALGLLLLISGREVRPRGISYIVIGGGPTGPTVAYDMPYVPGGGGTGGPAAGTGTSPTPHTVPPPESPGAPRVQPGEGAAVPTIGHPDTITAVPTRPGGLGVGVGKRILRPDLGDGRVWVRPWDAIAAAIAGADDTTPVDAATHAARIDSAITARIMAFLDTLPPDSMATPTPKPWVTEISGQKWGLDGSWIYLGNIKLPTAILALLPLPQGNYQQAQRESELQRIRLDIMQAARRAQSASEFKKYVKETRERREAEREFKKNQRTPPDSSGGY